MNKDVQAKSIKDEDILSIIDRVTVTMPWAMRWDFEKALPFPEKVIRAKCASMVRRGLIKGCLCGCRGEFKRAIVEALP